MSAFVSAAVLTVAGSVYTQQRQASAAKKAAKKAREQAKKDMEDARRAEVFAETEGEGVGQIGEVSLAIDTELDDEEIAQRQGSLRV